MQRFNAETLNAETDLNVRIVETPELGEGMTCCIAEMTADEAEERLWLPWNAYKESTKQDSNKRFRAYCAIATLCDESRAFVYPVAQIHEAAEKLAAKSTKAVERLFLAADYLNAIRPASIEAIEKN